MDHGPGTRAAPAWVVVLPVKHADSGKSRLRAPAGVDRSELARAIALDSLAAVRGCHQVRASVVVTGDPVVGPRAAAAGDVLVPDGGGGLGQAVDDGLAHARRTWPGHPAAVLLPDVPALRPADLGHALIAASHHAASFVPDLAGSGTVLLAGSPGRPLTAAFGEGSAARHEALGATRLDLDLPALRRDVDTLDDLRLARELGLGPHCQRLLLPGLAGSAVH